MKKIILLVVLMLVVCSYSVVAWDPNPVYDPFEILWNAINNASMHWVGGDGKVTTDVNVGIGTMYPESVLDVVADDEIGLQVGELHDETVSSPNTPIPIPDNFPPGVEDTITFPDMGIAHKIIVSINISNSDITGIKITLTDPNSSSYTLYDKSGSGTELATSYPDPTPTVSGDLNTWIGQNPQGSWVLKVVDDDYLNNNYDGQINSWSISIKTIFGETVKIENGDVIVDGSVGIGTTNPSAKLDVEVSSGGAATIGNSGNSATGDYAIAMGFNTTASGGGSTAMGYNTTASGGGSTAMGSGTTASGGGSTAMGYSTEASGRVSTAMGSGTTASGDASTAMGSGIEAAGAYSVGIGLDYTPRTITQDNTMAIMGGDVGIGTDSPVTKLQVNGRILSTEPIAFSTSTLWNNHRYDPNKMQHRISVSAGTQHTCVLKANGNVECYGYNYYGQSNNYTFGDAIGVSAGGQHTCVLKSDGNVYCYGDNSDGQSADYNNGDAIGVSAGYWHTCVLRSDGNVDCYGQDDYGQDADYNNGDAIGVSAGGRHTCVLKSNGNVDCYGYDDYGQSADYTAGDAIGVATGGDHTCVLKSNGNVDCYGRDDYGQDADYTAGDAIGVSAGNRHNCVLKSNGNVECYGYDNYGQDANYTGGDAIGVSAGGGHTCVLKSNGNVECYGDNTYGKNANYTSGDAKNPFNSLWQQELYASEIMRLVPTDSPGTCSSALEGSVYYDDSLNEMCYCDGSNWNQFDGGGVC